MDFAIFKISLQYISFILIFNYAKLKNECNAYQVMHSNLLLLQDRINLHVSWDLIDYS